MYAYAGNSPLSASDPTGFSWASDAGDAIGNALGLGNIGTDAANAISNATRSVFGPVDPGRWGQQGAAAGAASGAIVGGVAGGVAGAAAGSLAAPGVGTVAVGVGGAAEGAAAGAGLGAAAGGALGYGAGVAVHAAEGDDNAAPPAKDDVSVTPAPPPNEPDPQPPLTPAQQKSIKSLQDQIDAHQQKLDAYRQDPDAFDNKGFLKNAPNDDVRDSIIQGRIDHLQREIDNFRSQVGKIRGGS